MQPVTMLHSAHLYSLLSTFLIGALIVTRTTAASQLGNTFKICKATDPELDQCVVDSLNGARGSLAKGLPDFGLPPLSAMPLRLFAIDEGPGDFHLRTTISNGKWTGLDKYKVISAKIDLKRPYIEFTTFIPKAIVSGQYTFDGRVLTFRVIGDGTCDIEFGKINATHRMNIIEEDRNGEKYWKVSKYVFDMEMENVKVNYRNLFKGNRRLGTYANNFFNTNWKLIYQVYGTFIKEALGVSFMEYANILLEKVPVKDIFLH